MLNAPLGVYSREQRQRWLDSDCEGHKSPNRRCEPIMNPDHLQRLEALLPKQLAEMRLKPGAALYGPSLWDDTWKEVFPRGFVATGTGLDLEGADLYGYVFCGPRVDAPLVNANFRHANLSRTTWLWSTISDADFTDADLSGSKMANVRGPGSVFTRADLTDARLHFKTVEADKPIDLSYANLNRATIVLEGAGHFIVDGADFTGASIEVETAGSTTTTPTLFSLGTPTAAKDDRTSVCDSFLNCLTPEQRASLVQVSTESSQQASRCFIASAAYCDNQHPDVEHLRAFRDSVLAGSLLGRFLIVTYERGSPRIALLVSRHPKLQAISRILLRPAVIYAARRVRRHHHKHVVNS